MAEFPEADAYSEGADGCSDHGSWRSESPMWVQGLNLIQLVQEDGGFEFAILSGPEALYRLVDCFFVPVMKQVRDFPSTVHGLDLDLDGFRFVS